MTLERLFTRQLSEGLRDYSQEEDAQDLDYHSWLMMRFPNMNWTWRHSILISSYLDAVFSGEKKRVIFNLPPQHGKTEQVTIRFPLYIFENYPGFRLIQGSYNQTKANTYSRKTKRLVRDNPRIAIDRYGKDTESDWDILGGGRYLARGVGAGTTGEPADGVLIDDPIKNREEAMSETYREKTWGWFKEEMYTRLQQDAWVIIILTRWHHEDLVGKLMNDPELSKGYDVLSLEATCESDDDPLGREYGEALCPDRFDEVALADKKLVLGDRYEALYQQRPSAKDGDIVKTSWFKEYEEIPLDFIRIIQAWDTAQKDKERHDYAVCTTFGQRPNGDIYILDVYRERLIYPALKLSAKVQINKHKPTNVIIEDAGHGTALGQELQLMSGIKSTIHLVGTGSIQKTIRLSIEMDVVEAGKVYRPAFASWLADWTTELSQIPNGKYDDQGDSLAVGLCWLRNHSSTMQIASAGTRRSGYGG